ncbi:hypothetical protein BC938DRAFT_475099 [Jimgerdemannia flammicorona]|uniref:Uncharacterized protein n=1 Tax=Jimgerdemannia flammicorona TaxID=994334 RepID=A0A433Q0Z5_9FUNG|nr:hypothetical protein BC938DRAFT_475099 [Jimgerdemannia flammicorona]
MHKANLAIDVVSDTTSEKFTVAIVATLTLHNTNSGSPSLLPALDLDGRLPLQRLLHPSTPRTRPRSGRLAQQIRMPNDDLGAANQYDSLENVIPRTCSSSPRLTLLSLVGRGPPPKIECKDKNLTPWDGPVKFLFLPDEYKSVAVLLIPPASVKVTQLPAEDTTAHVAIKLSDPLILGDERQQRSVSVTAFDHNGAYVVEIATPKHRPKGKLSTKDCHRGRLPRRAYQLRRPEPAPSSTIVKGYGLERDSV